LKYVYLIAYFEYIYNTTGKQTPEPWTVKGIASNGAYFEPQSTTENLINSIYYEPYDLVHIRTHLYSHLSHFALFKKHNNNQITKADKS